MSMEEILTTGRDTLELQCSKKYNTQFIGINIWYSNNSAMYSSIYKTHGIKYIYCRESIIHNSYCC